MKLRLSIPLTASLFLTSTALIIGTAPDSFAASTVKATPKPSVKATPKATPKTKAKASPKTSTAMKKPANLGASTRPDGAAGEPGDVFASLTSAQRTCLTKAGVTLPTPGATRIPPTASPNASRPAGGFAGGFDSAQSQAAFNKCGITLPTGGFNGGTNFDPVKLKAFQTCMAKAGFKDAGGFGRYDQSDPDTALALVKCQKSSGFTLPKAGQQPGTSK